MGATLNKETYKMLIDADLKLLEQIHDSLEKEHIKSVLKDSVGYYYSQKDSQVIDLKKWKYCPKCGTKLHVSGQCVNQFCSGFSLKEII